MTAPLWQSALTVAVGVITVALAVWLPVAAVRRWVPARWRAVTASVGAVAVLAVGGGLAVLSFAAFGALGA